MTPEIVAVTHASWSVFDAFFADYKPECNCRWPRLEPMTFTPGEGPHRREMRKLVASGACPGLVACVDGRGVGWCAVAPKVEFPQYAHAEVGAWAIACLTVSAEVRGQGIGRLLVEAALSFARDRGATRVDGPPPWWKAGSDELRLSTVRVLGSSGFERVGESARMPVLRKVF